MHEPAGQAEVIAGAKDGAFDNCIDVQFLRDNGDALASVFVAKRRGARYDANSSQPSDSRDQRFREAVGEIVVIGNGREIRKRKDREGLNATWGRFRRV